MTKENPGFLGKMLPHLRHLGGRLTADKGNECEIQFRIKAINTGWVQMGVLAPSNPMESKKNAIHD